MSPQRDSGWQHPHSLSIVPLESFLGSAPPLPLNSPPARHSEPCRNVHKSIHLVHSGEARCYKLRGSCPSPLTHTQPFLVLTELISLADTKTPYILPGRCWLLQPGPWPTNPQREAQGSLSPYFSLQEGQGSLQAHAPNLNPVYPSPICKNGMIAPTFQAVAGIEVM